MEQASQGCHGTSVTGVSYRKYPASRLPHKRKTYNIEEKLKQQVQYWTKTTCWCSDKSQKILLLYGCS